MDYFHEVIPKTLCVKDLKMQLTRHFFFPFLQLISGLPQVEACVVLLHERSRLLAFVVPSPPADEAAAPPLLSVQQREDQTVLPRTPAEATAGEDGEPSRLVLRQLSLLLPSHSVPDTLVVVPALCQTAHGEKSQPQPDLRGNSTGGELMFVTS